MADRVPWLVTTGFATHLQGLRDAEILSSYALLPSTDTCGSMNANNPSRSSNRVIDVDDYDDDSSSCGGSSSDDDDDGGDSDKDRVYTDLSRILEAADSTFRDAYALCSNTSPNRKMTQHRAKRLSNFCGGSEDSISSAKASKFRAFKNESSLKSYFRVVKQLLLYAVVVVIRRNTTNLARARCRVVRARVMSVYFVELP